MSKLYNVEGVDRPLRLSDEHAERIGAKLYEPPTEKADDQADDRPKANATKDEWVAWATSKGVSFAEDKTLDELKALKV